MTYKRPPFPVELWEANYNYPDALFKDLPDERQAAQEEKVLRMAKFAVAESLGMRCSRKRLIEVCIDCPDGGFNTAIRKIRYSDTYGAIELADIEVEARVLGVDEYIWPPNPERMLEAMAIEQSPEETLVG